MNAPQPALVAPRPERLRLVGQRRQMLAVMHQRLMFGMLVYAGIVALIALRILWLAAFGDHAGRKEELTSFIPERGDIVDRDPSALQVAETRLAPFGGQSGRCSEPPPTCWPCERLDVVSLKRTTNRNECGLYASREHTRTQE